MNKQEMKKKKLNRGVHLARLTWAFVFWLLLRPGPWPPVQKPIPVLLFHVDCRVVRSFNIHRHIWQSLYMPSDGWEHAVPENGRKKKWILFCYQILGSITRKVEILWSIKFWPKIWKTTAFTSHRQQNKFIHRISMIERKTNIYICGLN